MAYRHECGKLLRKTEKKIDKIIKEYFKEEKIYPSYVLEKMLYIESILDVFLFSYFTYNLKEKRKDEFESFILDKMRFEDKIQLIEKLKLNDRNVTDFDSNFFQKIRWIQKIRNTVAHNQGYKKKKDVFYTYNIQKEKISIDRDFMRKFVETSEDVELNLIGLIGDLFDKKF
ncbi:MAG: hypothetical protein WDZ69_00290 [Candidatus Pacearchaeota archaeon]